MSKTIVQFLIGFVLLLLAQIVVFNHLVLFAVAVPLVFVYYIISMPVTWGTNLSMALGFLMGLAVDVFSDTQGMNALCCTILSFARKPIFHLYVQRDDDLSGLCPSLRSMGGAAFMKFMLTMLLAYFVMIFTIDAFALFDPLRWLLCVVCSTAYTFVIIYAIDSVISHRNEKRL